jgi:hypothetical protein
MTIPDEIARRTEQDRMARRSAYDQWARNYVGCGIPVKHETREKEAA